MRDWFAQLGRVADPGLNDPVGLGAPIKLHRAVERCTVVVPQIDISDEVGDGDRGLLVEQIDDDRTLFSHKFNPHHVAQRGGRRRRLGGGLSLGRASQRKDHGGQGGEDESAFHAAILTHNPALTNQSWKIRTARTSSAWGRQMNQ